MGLNDDKDHYRVPLKIYSYSHQENFSFIFARLKRSNISICHTEQKLK